MADTPRERSRRAFFLNGGAVLWTGMASATGVSSLMSENAQRLPEEFLQLQRQMEIISDCHAIRRLHWTLTNLIENQVYEAAAELFDEKAWLNLSGVCAEGKPAISRLFTDDYRQQRGATVHTAYRQNASQQNDEVTISGDRLQARATFHGEVRISTPLRGNSSAAQMARLQGQSAEVRWESGRFDGQYAKKEGQWKLACLDYTSAILPI